jgi:hypothetical protein
VNPATNQICGSDFAQGNLKEPDSLWVLLGIGTPGPDGCLVTKQEAVYYLDGADEEPQSEAFPTYQFESLYDDGVLNGGVAYDLFTGTVYLYSHGNVVAKLAEGGIPFPVLPAVIHDGTEFGNDVVYFEKFGFTGSSTLYRIDARTLTSSKVASVTSLGPVPAIADSKNLYYIASSSTSSNFYQVPLMGGTPKLLFTGTAGANSAYQWIGSTGSTLIFQDATVPMLNGNEDEAKATASVYTIPVGAHSTSATQIGGPYDGLVTGFPDQASLTAKPDVYINISRPASQATNASYTFSSVKIPLDGSSKPSPVANSAYGGDLILNSVPTIWQVTGINDTRGWGGGTVSLTNLETGASTKLTTTGGKTFTVPAGHMGILVDMIDANVAFGSFYPIASVPPLVGAAADLTHHFIYTVSILNTNVSIY